jgi:hypothetical protein
MTEKEFYQLKEGDIIVIGCDKIGILKDPIKKLFHCIVYAEPWSENIEGKIWFNADYELIDSEDFEKCRLANDFEKSILHRILFEHNYIWSKSRKNLFNSHIQTIPKDLVETIYLYVKEKGIKDINVNYKFNAYD